MEPITWPQLIMLMSFGDGPDDSIAGEVHVRQIVQVDEDFDEPNVTEHPTLGRVVVEEGRTRVYRRGDLLRREGLDGRLHMINGVETTWVWLDGADVPTAFPRGLSSRGSYDHAVVLREPPSRWEGDDFTKLTGPIDATELLGRPAWAFELAPPPHKPFPIQMTVDAATGLVLRQANAGFDSFAEWTSLEFGADLPDQLFVWDGPVKPQVDHESEIEQELAQRRAWLADRGVERLRVPAPVELMPHEWDDGDGSFYATFDVFMNGALARRPASDEPWRVVAEEGYHYSYQWTDGQWDWHLSSGVPLDDDQLAALRDQLP